MTDFTLTCFLTFQQSETCGVLLVVGYGLTECSPLICHRRTDSNFVAGGCVGFPVTGTEIRVVDVSAHTDKERPSLENGRVGLVLARGPQVMKGYYNNKKATDESIDEFGWFDTGECKDQRQSDIINDQ